MLILLKFYGSYREAYLAKNVIFAPSHSLNFLVTSIHCTSKEHIFHAKLGFMIIYRLKMKKFEKVNFPESPNSNRCFMYYDRLWAYLNIVQFSKFLYFMIAFD